MSDNLYGPNHVQVEALIDCIAGMTAQQVEQLAKTWRGTRSVARDAAWGAAWYAAQTAARYEAWDALDAAWDAAWDATQAATWAATSALVVRDLITPEQFDALYSPWASVMDKE